MPPLGAATVIAIESAEAIDLLEGPSDITKPGGSVGGGGPPDKDEGSAASARHRYIVAGRCGLKL